MGTHITTIFFDVGQTLLVPAVPEGLVFTEEAARFDVALDPALVDARVTQMYRLYEQLYKQDETFWSDEARTTAMWLKLYEYLCSLMGVEESKQAAIAQSVHRRYFSAASWKAYDDVLPALEALRERGLRMGLISNWDSTLEGIIIELGLAPYFEVILSSTVVRLHKPMPQIFELALKRMEVGPDEAIHVGDHLTADVAGALEAGIMPVLIDRRGTTRKHVLPNTAVVSDLMGLIDLLGK